MANNNSNTASKAVLKLAKPAEFNGTNESRLVTTSLLSKYINTLFKSAFKDYVGSIIKVVQPSESLAGEVVSLDLYFAPNSDNNKGQVAAFCTAGTDAKASAAPTAKNNIIGACLSHNQLVTTTSSMVVTTDAVSMLYPFILGGFKNRLKETSESFSKCGIAVETSMAGQYGMARPIIYNVIRGIDINAVMKAIFGDDENSFEFQVTPIKPISTPIYGAMNGATIDSKWIFSIIKLDKNNLNDLMNELGYYNKVANLGVATDTF